jgi:hypothetical protein
MSKLPTVEQPAYKRAFIRLGEVMIRHTWMIKTLRIVSAASIQPYE